MPVSQVVPQLEEDRGVYPTAVLLVQAHVQSESVGLVKAAADMGGGQDIRILPQQVQGLVAVVLVHPHGQHRAELEGADKLHQSPDAGLLPEALGHLLCLLQAHTLDACELFRLIFQHIQAPIAKLPHDEGGCRRTDPLHRAGGQVLINGGLVGRQHALGKLGLELPAVDAVGAPHAGGQQGLTGGGKRDGAHHRHGLVVFVAQTQDRIAVFFVFIDHRVNGSAELGQFPFLIHSGSSRAASSSSGFRNCPV